MICRACGGGRAHHAVLVDEDDGSCWCPTCRELPVGKRCLAFDPVPLKSRFAKTAKKATTSRPQVSLPRQGTLMRQVYDFLARSGLEGLTTSELEYRTAKPRDEVRATVAQLMGQELVENSGHKRARDLTSGDEVAWRTRTV